MRGAIAAYRKAAEVEPRYAPAWFNLGLGLRALGDESGAIEALRRAIEVGPDFAPAWQAFADAFAKSRFVAWSAQAAADLTRVLQHPAIDPGPLAEAAASLLALDPAIAPLMREVPAGARLQAAAQPMLLALIENALVPDPAFEAFLRALRASLLAAWRNGAAPPAAVDLACALAQQCFLNEYVWPESAAEAAGVARLADAARAAPGVLEIALLGAYRPLAAIPGLARPVGAGEPFRRLWRRQVEEPAEERGLRDAIEALTLIDDATSRAVQRQYEENPYPRWHRVPASLATPFPLRRALRELVPHVDPARLRVPDAPEVLIAGCGTGYQSAITALRNPGAHPRGGSQPDEPRVRGAPRARARPRARALRAGRHPEARRARRPLRLHRVRRRAAPPGRPGRRRQGARGPAPARRGDEARALQRARPAGRGRGAGADRAARSGRRSRGRARGAAARARTARGQPGRGAALGHDFYSASGARDLVLHVQEHRFTAAQLGDFLRALGLELLGFEFGDPAVPAAYRQRFPDDPAGTALVNWARFEDERPEAFSGMYQFWAARAA
ncbi:MAG: tetratricopeptide repeat protein [Burkholderiales bacterium]